jgi:predicted metal-dependent phosphoesterase TrpH
VISVDLHLHTCCSYDCATPLREVVRASRRAGLDCVAVTDHNTVRGALQMRDSGDFRVIVGEEISTTHGEMLGFFLSELVPRGLSPLETIDLIKAQGGLVCIPHPLGRRPFTALHDMGDSRESRYKPSQRVTGANGLLTEEVLARVDMVEVINSRTPFRSTWEAVTRLASLSRLPLTAGSDAHTAGEIGNARVQMPDFVDARSFLISLRQGQPSGSRSTPFVHFASMAAKLRRRTCSD